MDPLATVLVIVDGDDRMRETLGDYLEHEGYGINRAGDADEAFTALREARPDLVLLDIGLPGMDGLEVLRRIRHDAPNVGVILLTGDEDVELARVGLQIGAVDCLFKPIDLERLGRAVASSLEAASQGVSV